MLQANDLFEMAHLKLALHFFMASFKHMISSSLAHLELALHFFMASFKHMISSSLAHLELSLHFLILHHVDVLK